MKEQRYMYTIMRNNSDGKYWLWFDEGGVFVEGKYVPMHVAYHEIDTQSELREGATIWSNELESTVSMCQLRPAGQYSNQYVVKARIKDESAYLANKPENTEQPAARKPIGKKPGRG